MYQCLLHESTNWERFFKCPSGEGTVIVRVHRSHVKVLSFAGKRQYLLFSVVLTPWVLVRPPPALQSRALLTVLLLLRLLTLSPPECLMEFCKVTLTLSLRTKSYDVTIQMKSLCLYLHMVIFVFRKEQNEISKFGRNLLLAQFGSERVK